MDINSKAYKRAFINYLRRGIPIEVSLKQESVPISIHPAEGMVGNIEGNRIAGELPSQKYVWRTVGDDKVRPSHAANDGLVFSLDNPPPNGFPGSEHGCRCTAELYIEGETEYANQKVKIPSELPSPIKVPKEWSNVSLILYYYFGGGQELALNEIGHLNGVINYYLFKIANKGDGQNIYSRLNAQIINEARKNTSGGFVYGFNNSYSFKDYLYAMGDAVVSGRFSGKVLHKNGMMYIEGKIDFFYSDTFTDPINIREKIINGTSDPNEASRLNLLISDLLGQYFNITGKWQTTFEAVVKYSEDESIYKWEDN